MKLAQALENIKERGREECVVQLFLREKRKNMRTDGFVEDQSAYAVVENGAYTCVAQGM